MHGQQGGNETQAASSGAYFRQQDQGGTKVPRTGTCVPAPAPAICKSVPVSVSASAVSGVYLATSPHRCRPPALRSCLAMEALGYMCIHDMGGLAAARAEQSRATLELTAPYSARMHYATLRCATLQDPHKGKPGWPSDSVSWAETWEGGDASCSHPWKTHRRSSLAAASGRMARLVSAEREQEPSLGVSARWPVSSPCPFLCCPCCPCWPCCPGCARKDSSYGMYTTVPALALTPGPTLGSTKALYVTCLGTFHSVRPSWARHVISISGRQTCLTLSLDSISISISIFLTTKDSIRCSQQSIVVPAYDLHL